MQLSEEKSDHARTHRLKCRAEWQGAHWYRKCEAAKKEAADANERASEMKRSVTAAEQETRRSHFQNLSLQRQLSRLSDVVPRAEFVAKCACLESKVAEQAEQIAALRAQLTLHEACDEEGGEAGEEGGGGEEGRTCCTLRAA